MENPKIFAMYLPQYHCIPENDEFWGKGFTDWVTVKNAKPLYDGHKQPRVPYQRNYYDLSKVDHVEWQAKLAHDYGIYGFGVYHYWFNNEKNLLTRPAEILRDSKNGYVKYFLSWDNANWKRSWSNVKGNDWAPIADIKQEKQRGPQILIPYILGDEDDWRNHYDYVRTHFLSPNYEKFHNRPLFSIIGFSPKILQMCVSWDNWAKEDGFDGVCFIFQNTTHASLPDHSFLYNYEPHYVGWFHPSLMTKIKTYPLRIFFKGLRLIKINRSKGVMFLDYDKTWERLLHHIRNNKEDRIIQGAFVAYDDSPRRGKNGSKIIKGVTPIKFMKYFHEFFVEIRNQGKPYIFLTAWNEWGEGAYLEPDTDDQFEYLKAINKIVHDESI